MGNMQATLRALTDPIRREILTMLNGGRLSAGEISDRFPVSGAAVSRHLSVLKEAGLVLSDLAGALSGTSARENTSTMSLTPPCWRK